MEKVIIARPSAAKVVRRAGVAAGAATCLTVTLAACGSSPAPMPLMGLDSSAGALQSPAYTALAERMVRSRVEAAYARKGEDLSTFRFAGRIPEPLDVAGVPCRKSGAACRTQAGQFASAVDVGGIVRTAAPSSGADPFGATNGLLNTLGPKQDLVMVTPMAQSSDGFDIGRIDLSTPANVSRAVDELAARKLLFAPPRPGITITFYGLGTAGPAAASSTRAADERAFVNEACRRSRVRCITNQPAVA